MSAVTSFPQSDYPTRDAPDLQPHTKLLLGSDVAKAILLFVAGSICFVFVKLALDLKTGVNWIDVLTGICWLGFGAFLLVSARAFLQLFASDIHAVATLFEALAEIIVQRDLNDSGGIGDIKQINQPETEVKETIRFVPTNRNLKVVIAPDGTEIPKEDFVEFVRGLEVNGLTRSKWVSENAKKPFAFKFASGHEMTRELYDAMCEVLEKRARVLHGRKQGTSGTLTAKPQEILNILGLE